MKRDKKSCFPAEVDASNARFYQDVDLGIEFTNEIDVWTQMEFKARHQIKHLRQFGSHSRREAATDIYPMFYGTRLLFEG